MLDRFGYKVLKMMAEKPHPCDALIKDTINLMEHTCLEPRKKIVELFLNDINNTMLYNNDSADGNWRKLLGYFDGVVGVGLADHLIKEGQVEGVTEAEYPELLSASALAIASFTLTYYDNPVAFHMTEHIKGTTRNQGEDLN